MTNCNQLSFEFSRADRRRVVAQFDGGDISSDGGLLLLREVDAQIGLLDRAADLLPDSRDPNRIRHSQRSLLKQRVFGIAQGWEDLNDHDRLRNDPLLQTSLGSSTTLASAPTLCRMEHRCQRSCAIALQDLLVTTFIESRRDDPPTELILDFDATDDPVHGNQEGRFFHGYYDRYCFLPLYVFCDSQPLIAWLRPSNIDGARGSWLILKALVNRLRKAWPQVRIVFRADSGFCRWRMLRWCENNDVDYVVGLAKNKRLEREAAPLMEEAEQGYEQSRSRVRRFGWMSYAAKSWDRERTVIAKAEHSGKGSNPRFVITTLTGEAQKIYEGIYCARGDMENRIKEQQLGLFADRTSSHRWWPNQLRLLMSTLAYVLVETLRRTALETTDLAQAQVSRIRLELLKIGAVVVRNTRRIVVHLSSSFPGREIFEVVHRRLCLAQSG